MYIYICIYIYIIYIYIYLVRVFLGQLGLAPLLRLEHVARDGDGGDGAAEDEDGEDGDEHRGLEDGERVDVLGIAVRVERLNFVCVRSRDAAACLHRRIYICISICICI